MRLETTERPRSRAARRGGQLQSMETIIVVIMLIFLIILGALFYAANAKDSMRAISVEARLSQLETLAKKLHYLPELSCTNYGAAKTPCVDIFKADIFSGMLTVRPALGSEYPTPPLLAAAINEYEELRLDYYPLFGDSLVMLQVIYPPDSVRNITLYNASKGEDVQSRMIPVAIHDPVSGSTGLGYLYAETD